MLKEPKITKTELIKYITLYNNIFLIAKNTSISVNTIRFYMKKYGIDSPAGFYKQLGPRKKRKPVSENVRQVMSERFKGEKNPFYGKKHSEETRQKMRENHADFSGNKNPFKNACIKNPKLIQEASDRKIKEWNKLSPIERYHRNKKVLVGDLSSGYWTNIINNAKTRNLEFSITPEYAWMLFVNQNYKCSLSGIDLNLKTIYEITASLDRINSSLGYVESNVQWVHKDINIMKNVLKNDDFIDICILVANHSIKI